MWLYVPSEALPTVSTSSPSAPEAAGSISASDWRFPALASSAWWRGKPSPSRTWFKRCERVSFIRLLCGAMPEPSAAEHGVAAWTASLAASRASRTASPASASPNSMSATSGLRPGASSRRRGPGSSSSRMSAACSHRAGPSGFGESWGALVSSARWDFSRRRRSGSRTPVSAFSYSVSATLFPTPSARDFKGANSAGHLDRSTGSLHLDQLPNFVRHIFRPALDLCRNGQNSLPQTPVLNPRFVERLMGWPPLWTLSECSETALSRFRQHMRCALSQLASHDAALPAQLALFG